MVTIAEGQRLSQARVNREWAALEVQERGVDAAVQAAIDGLKHPDWNVRLRSARIILKVNSVRIRGL